MASLAAPLEGQSGALVSPLAAAAQQFAVAAFHSDDGVLDEPDRLTANRGRLPGIPGHGSRPIKRQGNFTIASLGLMAVEGANHQDKALTQARGQVPSSRKGSRCLARETTLQAQQTGNTEQNSFIQGDDSCHP